MHLRLISICLKNNPNVHLLSIYLYKKKYYLMDFSHFLNFTSVNFIGVYWNFCDISKQSNSSSV